MSEGFGPDLVIYHGGGCQDGHAAAWAVWQAFGDAPVYRPAVYGDRPPVVRGEHVVILDFSWPAAELLAMAGDAASLLVLDHHVTAQADLEWLPEVAPSWLAHRQRVELATGSGQLSRAGAFFDMDRSGCSLAWEAFHPHRPMPTLLRHVEDRDLWRWRLPRTRELMSAVFSYPMTFDAWDVLVARASMPETLAALADEGVAIERARAKTIADLIEAGVQFMTIGGTTVPVLNVPKSLASDTGHLLAEDAPFAATYVDRPDGRREFSLRSRAPDGRDVSAVARAHGGGGHKHAAGFLAPAGWRGDDPALTDVLATRPRGQ